MTKNFVMKTRFATPLRPRKFFPAGAVVQLVRTITRADTNFTAGSFVEALPGFVSVASGVNPADGVTYLVGKNDSSQAILKKYDSSGAQIFWEGTNVSDLYISGITPSSLAIGVGTTNFYIAGGSKILRLSTKSGQVLATADASSASLKLQGLYYWNNTLYACGNLVGGGFSLPGINAPARGSQAGILMKFASSLPSTAQSLITFGNTGGSAANTADSIVVDDSGDVYVSGHLDTGSFASSVFTPGSWTFNRKYASVGLFDIPTADNVYFNNANVTSTDATTFPFTVDFHTDSGNNYVTRATGVFMRRLPAVTLSSTTLTTAHG